MDKQVNIPKKRKGRPSKKDPNKKYVKVGANVLISTRSRMKMALLTSAKDLHSSQDEIIEAAIHFYLDSIEEGKQSSRMDK